jgi:hypothetical protein
MRSLSKFEEPNIKFGLSLIFIMRDLLIFDSNRVTMFQLTVCFD